MGQYPSHFRAHGHLLRGCSPYRTRFPLRRHKLAPDRHQHPSHPWLLRLLPCPSQAAIPGDKGVASSLSQSVPPAQSVDSAGRARVESAGGVSGECRGGALVARRLTLCVPYRRGSRRFISSVSWTFPFMKDRTESFTDTRCGKKKQEKR